MMESGYSAPCNWYCRICDKYYDKDGEEHKLEPKKEIKDPSNPGEYMSAFANKPIPIEAIHTMLRKYRFFDPQYAVRRVSEEYDISPKIIWGITLDTHEKELSE
jgi:hypothetical protein